MNQKFASLASDLTIILLDSTKYVYYICAKFREHQPRRIVKSQKF